MENLGKVAVFDKANPRSAGVTTKAPKARYSVKVNYEKSTVTLAKKLFDDLQLANNSLSFAPHPTKEGEAIAIVYPGNAGTSLKGVAGKQKGKSFKNSVITNFLSQIGKASGKFNLEPAGVDENGYPCYQFVEFAPASAEAPAAEAATAPAEA